ncbi:LamG-like jellyroll fold domain-containing protein [Polymorphospora sp. NPDC050346]|uniref:LamG-like jellyroll fold domain-containing protein n=1 Tax=Polymorphospora sp. NPDC050346 TaxID=3155780 RepID=UPI0033F64F30
MPRWGGRALRRGALIVAVVFGLTVAVPPGAVPAGGSFPTSWLSWFAQRPSWADGARAFLGMPVQRQGESTPPDHYVSADATRAVGGAGRVPAPAPGTLAPYTPHEVDTTPQTTASTESRFDPKTSKRQPKQSTARTDVFRNADGSITRRTYTDPVNYRTADGSWQPIDPTLVERPDGRLHVKANSVGIAMAGESSARSRGAAADTELAALTLPTGEVLAWSLQGAQVGTPETDGGTATYRDVLPDTDLELTAIASGVKETLVLKSPAAGSSWVFPLRLEGLTPRLDEHGSVELVNAKGSVVAWIPSGWMEDSRIDPRSGSAAQGAVRYELTTVDGRPALRVVADAAWLNHPDRVYPVRVDPTAHTDTTGDVYIDNDPNTTNQNGDNLPVGTYNGGGVKARSFIHFDDYRNDGFNGLRITGVRIWLYQTWAYSCTTFLPFYVHRVTGPWTVAGLTNAGLASTPAMTDPIGQVTVNDHGPSCTNTSGNRSVGKWVRAVLNPATFNDWGTGGANHGLALTASETDSNGWKRFTSANYSSGDYMPYLELDYTYNHAPQVDVRYPGNNAVLQTLTPELVARVHDPDKWPNKGFSYHFVVFDGSTGTQVANSGWVGSQAWRVPAGSLAWNKKYLYTVQVNDRASNSTIYPALAFSTRVPQPLVTSGLAQNAGKGFDPSIGNYTTSATDASIATVGPSLSITRSYNSLDTRRANAFGAGWSTVVDVRATEVKDAANSVQSVLVRYPSGQEVPFGRNADGSFTPPPGRFATFKEVRGSGGTLTGYTLTDKDATVYTFGQPSGAGAFAVTAIADANGRTLTLTYDGSGRATKLTSASGRSLNLTWTTPAGSAHPHISTVTTDPVVPGNPTTVTTWQYTYGTEDRLAAVCPPTGSTECTTYTSDTTSQYANTVLNSGPSSYWRFEEATGATVAGSQVLSNAGADNAGYANVTLGQANGLPGSTATAAAFDGTTSSVQLPGNLISDGEYQSVAMRFKTTGTDGVLFSYSRDPITNSTTAGNYVPALYIGSDGKLRGQFWQGAATPITSPSAVNDGQWHQVVLAGAGTTQTLYLDGVAIGTLGGPIAESADGGANSVYVGAGFVGGTWPNHARSNQAAGVSRFNGAISDVAFFNQTLTAATVAALQQAGTASHHVLNGIVRPSGGITAQVSYDKATGKVASVTDENGGTWTMGTPTVSGSSDVYRAAVLGSKPTQYWRFGEVGVSDAVNDVRGGTATYNNVTLGVDGPFADSKAASFNGTSSYVTLPETAVPTTGPNSVEMWFKMPSGNNVGGVLFGYQGMPMDNIAGSGGWVPALYVGTDGKLRGTFNHATSNPPVTSAGSVNDGKWHHVVLSAGGSTQSVYLDGVLVGTMNRPMVDFGATYAYVGAGKWQGSWPNHGTSSAGYWPGSIAEVAFYNSQLSAAQVGAHFEASKQTAPVALTMVSGVATAIPMPVSTVEVTGPTGEKTSYSYDVVNGNRIIAQSDALGNVTRYGYDVGGFGNLVYDPRGVWTQTLQDVRGNTRQSITCQDQAANRCSSVYFTYYPDATSTTLTPDARNDLLLTVRDGRSASATDNTYLTTFGYDAKGNRTTVTDSLARVTTTAYTDGTTVAAHDGGFAPAGLPSTATTPAGTAQSVVYYANGDVAEVTEPAGKVIRYTFDGLGRLLTETEITDTFPAGLTTTYTYDALGRMVTETEPAVTNRVTGAVHTARTTLGYDVDGNVVGRTTADTTGGDAARTETYTYNAHGQETTYTSAAGATTTFEYDPHGRIVEEIEPDDGVTRNTYDAAGNLLTTKIVGFTGDPNDPDPAQDLTVATNAYDPAGRLASETDAMGWTTEYTYTDNGLPARTTRTDGTSTFVVEQNTYDAAGNVVKRVTNNGATTVDFTIDAAGREVSSTVDPTGLNRTTTRTYDRNDNVVSTRMSRAGTTLGITDAAYDPMGRLVSQATHTSTESSPTGRWRLDETTGGKAGDSAGGNTATANAAVTWSNERGGAVALNGSNFLTTVGPTVDTTDSYTVSAWVKLTSASYFATAVSQDGNRTSGFFLQYFWATNRWALATPTSDTDNPPATRALSTSVPQLNTWTHLTGVYDATAGELRLYVNGILEGTAAKTSSWPSSGAVAIGRAKHNGQPVDRWPGSVSDVQTHGKALNATEVTALYNGTGPAAGAGTIRTTYDLDQDGNPVAVTDPNGNTTYHSYDEAGRAVKTTAPPVMAEVHGQPATLANAISWVGYNTFGEITDTKDPNGNWGVTGYDAAGRVVSETLPSYTAPGSSTPVVAQATRTYDVMGQLTSATDPLGKTTSYVYDQMGRVAKVTAPNDGETTYTYDHVGDLLSQTDPTGAVTSSTYDYLGRQLTTTQVVRQTGTNHTTTYAYGTNGWLSQVTSPTGVTSSTTYNAIGERLTTTDGANQTTTHTYDGAGRQTRTTLPDGTYTSVSHDLAGRPLETKVHNAAGTVLSTQSSEFDKNGNVVAATDAKGTTISFEYDATGMLVREIQPISGSDDIQTTFGYDLAGNRTRFTDGRGNAFFTTYNSWNLPEWQVEPATTAHPSTADRTFVTAYDAAGRPVTQTSPGGVTVTNTYDDLGLLTAQVGAGAEATTEDREFGYDVAGRMTSFSAPVGTNNITYDDRGLPLTITGPVGNATYTYTADSRLASRADAAGTTSFTYDGAGRLSTVNNPTAGVALTNTYNALSQVSKITYGSSGNSRNFTFDARHRPVTDELKTPSGTSIAKVDYGWDANDNIVSKTTTGFTGAATNTYTYDLADRLTSWNDGTTTTVYAYDKAGNRVQNGSRLFTYDQRNRLLTAAGDSYSYTPRGTLATVSGGSGTRTTSTDAFGQVRAQQAGGTTQSYDYDAFGRVLRSGFAYAGLGNDLAADGGATYVRDPAGDLIGAQAGGTQRLVWTDLHTDVIAQFTATGTTLSGSTTYDPLGTVVSSAGQVGSLGYQSEWTDTTTDRVNMWARWYNTDTGQFDTRDSANVSPVPASIAANRYQYGDGNPLTTTDPTGHWGNPIKAFKKAVKATVSRVTTYVSSAYRAVTTYVSQKVQAVARVAATVVNNVKKAATKVAKTVKKAVDTGRKYVAQKYQAVKKQATKVYNTVKQAHQKVVAKATRVVKKTVAAVSDGVNAATKWVKENKDMIIEVAAIGGAILAGLACTAVTAGVGAVACMVGAGAVINLAKDAAQGDIHSIGDALGSMATGALSGLAGGAGGMIAGKVAAAVGSRIGNSVLGRLATEAVENGISDAFDQVLTTGRFDPKAMLAGMIPGLGGANRKAGANPTPVRGGTTSGSGGGGPPAATRSSDSGSGGSCTVPQRKHSFDPSTRVLMADGSVRPIEDINIGDQVLATDPETGVTLAKPVTQLHRNTDHELTDLTIETEDGETTVLKTTQNHPFWDGDSGEWVDAAELKAEAQLATIGSGNTNPRVASVANHLGTGEMRDLTVADIHTYYVIAGTTPVLVHNCGTAPIQPTRTFRNESANDHEPQAPLPRSAFNENGQNLANGDHHYVVMRNGSVRTMFSRDMEAIHDTAGHTSLSEGEPVFMAGHFQVSDGRIVEFDNWSGHYSPNNDFPGYRPIADVAREALVNNGFPGARTADWDDITK